MKARTITIVVLWCVFVVAFGATLLNNRVGTYYIEFDGSQYWTWERGTLGFDHVRGLDRTEQDARNRIERFKRNPPRYMD